MWKVPKIWQGGEVWIIGGGTSMPLQFDIPKEVINEVVSGKSNPSAYSPFLSSIHNKHVIGINIAYMIGDWIDMIFFGDKNFFLNHLNGLAQHPGLKVSCHSFTQKYDWVKCVPRNRKKRYGISDDPRLSCWNGNSGAAAISVVANAGAKRIILLGFDMDLGLDDRMHWHNLYGKKNPKRTYKNRTANIFDIHLKGFPAIARDAKMRGIEIINASPNSKIECFPKVTVKELL